MASRPLKSKLFWFVVLWVGGVAAVSLLSLLLRWTVPG